MNVVIERNYNNRACGVLSDDGMAIRWATEIDWQRNRITITFFPGNDPILYARSQVYSEHFADAILFEMNRRGALPRKGARS